MVALVSFINLDCLPYNFIYVARFKHFIYLYVANYISNLCINYYTCITKAAVYLIISNLGNTGSLLMYIYVWLQIDKKYTLRIHVNNIKSRQISHVMHITKLLKGPFILSDALCK